MDHKKIQNQLYRQNAKAAMKAYYPECKGREKEKLIRKMIRQERKRNTLFYAALDIEKPVERTLVNWDDAIAELPCGN